MGYFKISDGKYRPAYSRLLQRHINRPKAGVTILGCFDSMEQNIKDFKGKEKILGEAARRCLQRDDPGGQ